MKMKILEYNMTFHSPAFLGNAEQSGQWRTPPIKALLRQWWRVAYAADKGFKVDVGAMRRDEGCLFGHAWLDDDRLPDGTKVTARKSRVLIRLGQPSDGKQAWVMGSQQGVSPLSTNLNNSYAWFGLVKRGSPDRTAIKAGNDPESTRMLRLAVPDEEQDRFQTVLRLIDAFGQIGSRSRGGWGSLHVSLEEPMQTSDMVFYSRELSDCLKQDWPLSLANDSKGLMLWDGKRHYETWYAAMESVASERKSIRTALKLPQRDLRPVLGFATPGRMPSPLRWKVIPAQNGKLAIRIFAMPHFLPIDSRKNFTSAQLEHAWNTITKTLDNSALLTRSKT
jgi:CRISPR-associated protein Cmr1